MEFKYKGKNYMLGEVTEPNKKETYDMIVIFREVFIDEKTNCEVSKEEFEEKLDGTILSTNEYIDYFYGADATDEELIQIAKEFIDRKK